MPQDMIRDKRLVDGLVTVRLEVDQLVLAEQLRLIGGIIGAFAISHHFRTERRTSAGYKGHRCGM